MLVISCFWALNEIAAPKNKASNSFDFMSGFLLLISVRLTIALKIPEEIVRIVNGLQN